MTTQRYPRIASRLYNEPWLLLPSKFRELTDAFESARAQKFLPEEDSQGAADPVGPEREDLWGKKIGGYAHPQVEVIDGVAVAQVKGVMGRGLSNLAMRCGGFDTGLFREQLKNIAEDDSIKTLVINFDTPGGMASGNLQVANDIRAVSAAGKNVIGYAEMLCASAGFFARAACDEFHAHPDAILGSISTVYAGIDSSKAFEMEGLKLELFATGKYKATGMPGKEWTEEERQMIWERIWKIDAEFKGYVSDRLGVAPAHMEGQWWYAKHAPAGVVDSTKFDSLAQVLELAFSL